MLKKIFVAFFIGMNFIWGFNLPGFYNISSDSTAPVFVVDKAKQMFYIFRSNGPGRLMAVDSIPASTGTIRGDKKIEGDERTPEGIYTITNKITESDLPKIYGPLALILDYPNTVDRLLGNGGSNIWLHGRSEKLAPRQTEGCVSLENHSILEVNEKFVDLGQTKIIIYDSLEQNDLEKYHQQLKKWEKRVKDWRDAWQFGKFDKYKNFYSEKFQDYTSLAAYVERKQRIDRSTPWKKINTEDIRALVADYEARILFQQEYITPDFISLGNKELTFLKSDNNWQIVSEDFTPLDEQIDFNSSIQNFVDNWEVRQEEQKLSIIDGIQGHLIVNNVKAGLGLDTIYASFELTVLSDSVINNGECKLYLDYEKGAWHIIIEKYEQQKQQSIPDFAREYTDKWAQAWSSEGVEEYLAFYSKNDFSTNEDDYDSFARRKKQLDRIYSWIDIDLKKLESTVENENINISFVQNYNCPRFFLKGEKTLTLARETTGWKIINEDFTTSERQEIEPELKEFVNRWQKAWESKNIDSYIEFYASEFESGEFDRQSWYQDKKEKFNKSENIKIETSNYKINSPDEYVWNVTFRQIYNSGRYSDRGNKLLVIKGRPGNFNIINEKWWK
ncbi:MAG: L,D-transpeptidase family protein [Candidatus Marinimicrobia bacterium]|nr:L,D-transpeptidase family protein [Candidatus Neomarinimicrobiota bacterium]